MKHFPVRRSISAALARRPSQYVRAVENVNFEVLRGEIFGIVGESGSGKTTTARMLVGLTKLTQGEILYRGRNVAEFAGADLRRYHQRAQMIFQDPYESLSPRLDAYSAIAEGIRIHHLAKSAEQEAEMISRALEEVELKPPEDFVYRLPHELSGGQRQRLAIARSLVLKPDLIVADEPVSMLDVSIRAEILNLLKTLRDRTGITIVLITHDLAVARHLCDRIVIMYLGKVMEQGTVHKVILESLHPYTRALIAAVPVPDPTAAKARVIIPGEIPSPLAPPPGCCFHTRCPSYIGDICKDFEPRLIPMEGTHQVACHLYPQKHTSPIEGCCAPTVKVPAMAEIREN